MHTHVESEEFSKVPLFIRNSAGRFDKGQTLAKLLRDSQRLRKQARWVLVIDKEGKVRDMFSNDAYVANIIAVLGPAVFCGVAVPDSVLLEIGISKGRPYKQAESIQRGGRANRERMKGRLRTAHITFEQLHRVWPMVVSICEEVVEKERSTWEEKNRGGWFVHTEAGVKSFERGISFSISHTDHVLHEAFLMRDADVRRYLRKNARTIRYFLRRCRYVYYPEKQLKSLVGVQKVVQLWRNMSSSPRWSPRYAHLLINFLPSAPRALFRHIAGVYNLDIGEHFEADKSLQSQAKKLIFPAHLHVRWERDGGKVQGKGCSLFEVFFESNYRKERGI